MFARKRLFYAYFGRANTVRPYEKTINHRFPGGSLKICVTLGVWALPSAFVIQRINWRYNGTIKKNLMEVPIMLFKHPFLNLNIGLVKENFVIAKKDDKKLQKSAINYKNLKINFAFA